MRRTRADRGAGNKDTRWDRIRKRYVCNASVSLNTDAVRRFIDMDFIGRHNESLLRGERHAASQLDPALVMDMRHKMFQRIPHKLPLATVAGLRNVDACVSHNQAVEERYIANELNKFRQQLEKQHKRNQLRPTVRQQAECALQLDSEGLMHSLEATARHIEGFYAAPIAALTQAEQLCRAGWEAADNKENEMAEACGYGRVELAGGSKEGTEFGYTADIRDIKGQGTVKRQGQQSETVFSMEITNSTCNEKVIVKCTEHSVVYVPEITIEDRTTTQLTKRGISRENGGKISTAKKLGLEVKNERKNAQISERKTDTKNMLKKGPANGQKIKIDQENDQKIAQASALSGNGESERQIALESERECKGTQAPSIAPEVEREKIVRENECQAKLDEINCKCCTSGSVAQRARCVRFEEAVQVRKFRRQTSNCSSHTSDDIDSVISDLAEEALFELQMEEQTKAQAGKEHDPAELAGAEVKQPVAIGNDRVATARIDGSNTDNALLIVKRLQLPADAAAVAPKTPHDALSNSDEATEEESASNHEQNRIIEQLFQSRAHTNLTTLRKYFLKWIHYTTLEKLERENVSSTSDRAQKISFFLEKLRREKLRQHRCRREGEGAAEQQAAVERQRKPGETAQITKKYQTKIKVQQDIIDLQRVKLERQERLIMQLKLHKLSEAAQEARQEIKNELKSVIRSGDPKAKAKAKCLQLIGNLRDTEDEEFARLRGRALFVPRFLHEMQERALERNVRHEQARQRRLQQEAEKEAQKIAAEEAKRLEDEEAKRQRIEALKEKRRQEKLAKINKERDRQRAIEAKHKSDAFCRRLLLRRVGMEGFKRLLQRKRDNQRKCELLRRNLYKRTYFEAWRDYYVQLCAEKQARAEQLHALILKRTAMGAWLLYLENERSKYHVAVDWCDYKRTEAVFKRWSSYTQRMCVIEATKMHQAAAHHGWHLKWKVLDCWQRLPQILQLEKETEQRRQRWRMKIWELLPDYTPNRDTSP